MYYHHNNTSCHHKRSTTRYRVLKTFLKVFFSYKFTFSAKETNCTFFFFCVSCFFRFLSSRSLLLCFLQHDFVWGGYENHWICFSFCILGLSVFFLSVMELCPWSNVLVQDYYCLQMSILYNVWHSAMDADIWRKRSVLYRFIFLYIVISICNF